MQFKDGFVTSFKNFKSNISLEPVIILFVFCNFLANGAQQNNNILFKKICTEKLAYNSSICANHHNHPEFHLQVLKETNMYSLYLDFVGILPAILYVLIGGALSDKVKFYKGAVHKRRHQSRGWGGCQNMILFNKLI